MARYRRRGDVVTRTIAGEAFVVPVTGTLAESGGIFILDETGHFIWELLAASLSAEAIVEKICEDFDISPEQARMDVDSFLDELKNECLIQEV